MRVDVLETPDLGGLTEARPQAVPVDIAEPAEGALPLGRLAGLLASGAFAFVSSLTCFVC